MTEQTIPGVLWPIATNDNRDHDWIERDDEASIYPHDDAAAKALGESLGREVRFAWIDSIGRYAPYIDALPRERLIGVASAKASWRYAVANQDTLRSFAEWWEYEGRHI